MSKFDRTEPVAGSAVVSAPIRTNFQAAEDKILGASAKAQATPDLTVKIEAFVYFGADGLTRRSYAGGNSPALVAPAANPRIALLQIDDVAALTWKYGAEAPTPSAPNPDTGKVSICEVFQRVGMTQTKDTDDGTHGYIQRQASAIRAAGSGGGGVPGANFHEFIEIADPATPAADTLRAFAKDDGGNTRYAVKDAAARVLMLFGGNGVREMQIIRKTADEPVNNSSTLQNDDHLLAALAANETVFFMCLIKVANGSAASDFKMSFTGPAGSVVEWHLANGFPAPEQSYSIPDARNSGGVISTMCDGAQRPLWVVGSVRNGATAGNLQLQWAQDVAAVVDTKVLTDSYLMVWRS